MFFRKGALSALVVLAFVGAAHGAFAVMDQIGPDPSWVASNGLLRASQDFAEPALNAFDINAIDDFSMPATQQLLRVEAVVGFFNGPASPSDVQGYLVQLYSSPAAAGANLAGDVASILIAPGSAVLAPWEDGMSPSGQNRQLVSLDLSSLNLNLLGGNMYWIGVMPVMNRINVGQTGIASTLNAMAVPGNINALQANPGGAFGFGALRTIDDDENAANGVQGTNLAYRVIVTPEPATLALLGLGALLRKRR